MDFLRSGCLIGYLLTCAPLQKKQWKANRVWFLKRFWFLPFALKRFWFLPFARCAEFVQ